MSERDKSVKAHLALYRKYRSRNLDEIIGQPQVTDILKSVAADKKFAHAYLFTGQRGTGKTSVARILAHLINETEYGSPDIDIIEIDAASNNGVDDVRELRDNINLAPMKSPRKIYIIDEVHMLSTAAFNALLKTIEEPPAHVVFILATTEIQKMPATILSRVQRFHFRPVAPEIIAGHLRAISDQEKIAVDDDALLLIAERGGGSFRDSITLLDQLSGSSDKVTREMVQEILGLAPEVAIDEIINAIQNHNTANIMNILTKVRDDGVSSNIITEQLITKLSEIAIQKPRLFELVEKLLEVSKSAAPDIKLIAILMQFATISAPNKTIAQKSEVKLAKIIEEKIREENFEEEPERTCHEEQLGNGNENNNEKEEDVDINKNTPAEINWVDILNEVKNLKEPAVWATLKSADFDYVDENLQLFFHKAFHRKNAEKANFRDIINTAFQNLYGFSPRIIVEKSAKPAVESGNSDISQITAIMGGGEIIRETGV